MSEIKEVQEQIKADMEAMKEQMTTMISFYNIANFTQAAQKNIGSNQTYFSLKQNRVHYTVSGYNQK